jgi:hypothetical protein
MSENAPHADAEALQGGLRRFKAVKAPYPTFLALAIYCYILLAIIKRTTTKFPKSPDVAV